MRLIFIIGGGKMNWYIGQDIVAIKDHSDGSFKRGDEFKIHRLTETPCKCGGSVMIDIGYFNPNFIGTQCDKCGFYFGNGQFVFYESNFAPLDPIKEAISQLIEETLTIKQI